MMSKSVSVLLFTYLIGSTLCVIPEGEYQFGPLFPKTGNRFLGHKYFEAFFDKGNKPLLIKKVLLGVGAGAALAGGAILAKKIHENKGFGNLHGKGWNQPQNTGGWYGNFAGTGSEYASGQSYGQVNYPSTDYQYGSVQSQGYPSSAEAGYQDQYNYAGQQSNYYENSGWSQ